MVAVLQRRCSSLMDEMPREGAQVWALHVLSSQSCCEAVVPNAGNIQLVNVATSANTRPATADELDEKDVIPECLSPLSAASAKLDVVGVTLVAALLLIAGREGQH